MSAGTGEGPTKPPSKIQETCEHVAKIARELIRLASDANADRLAVLLAELAHQAEYIARQGSSPIDLRSFGKRDRS